MTHLDFLDIVLDGRRRRATFDEVARELEQKLRRRDERRRELERQRAR